MKTIWILGDQLHEDHPALARADRKKDRVLFIESRRRSGRVNYHKLKLVLIFSAMRHRAEALRKAGWQVDYVELTGNFTDGLEAHIAQHKPESVLMQEPSQYAFRQIIPKLARKIGVKIEVLPPTSFSSPRPTSRRGGRKSASSDGEPLSPRAQEAEAARRGRWAADRRRVEFRRG